QAFAREKYEEEQFDAVTAETVRESIRVARLEAAATRSSEIITALGTAAAVLFGALQVLRGRMMPGELVLVVGYLTNMYKAIVSLILRLYEPQEGAILVDGVDIRQYRRESLRRQIGLVLQQSLLFGATIRENIAYGRPEASADEIVAAANAANAHEFIHQLED